MRVSVEERPDHDEAHEQAASMIPGMTPAMNSRAIDWSVAAA